MMLSINGSKKPRVDPIQVIAERGRSAKLIRDSTRMKWLPSEVSLKSYTFLPIDTVLTRNARYAGKL